MSDQTVLSKATSTSASLRATVPRSIVKYFDLKEGDSLDWRLEIRDSRLRIEVSPLKSSRDVASNNSNNIRKRKLARNSEKADEPGDLVSGRRRWSILQREEP